MSNCVSGLCGRITFGPWVSSLPNDLERRCSGFTVKGSIDSTRQFRMVIAAPTYDARGVMIRIVWEKERPRRWEARVRRAFSAPCIERRKSGSENMLIFLPRDVSTRGVERQRVKLGIHVCRQVESGGVTHRSYKAQRLEGAK